MAYTITSSRLDFLRDSAQALSADSPSTSAYLLASHNRHLNEQNKTLTASQERDICLSCGSLRSPGWMSSISTQRNRKRNISIDAHKQNDGSSCSGVVYKCLRCNRHVTQSQQKPPKQYTKGKKTPIPSSLSAAVLVSATPSAATQPQPKAAETANITKPSDNASSKKRAKARKNQGLLASLAASKQQPRPQTSSNSLDLLDFLQS